MESLFISAQLWWGASAPSSPNGFEVDVVAVNLLELVAKEGLHLARLLLLLLDLLEGLLGGLDHLPLLALGLHPLTLLPLDVRQRRRPLRRGPQRRKQRCRPRHAAAAARLRL